MISVVRMTAASARWEAVEGQEPQGTWRCRESRRPPRGRPVGTWRGLCCCSGVGQVKRILVPETVLWR